MMVNVIEIEMKEHGETFRTDEMVVVVMEKDVDYDFVHDLGHDEKKVDQRLVRASVLCYAVSFWSLLNDSHRSLCLAHVHDFHHDAVCCWIVCFRHLCHYRLCVILFSNLDVIDVCLWCPFPLVHPIYFWDDLV